MPTLSAENAFKKGLSALVEQRPQDASEQFRKAIDLQKQHGARRLDMRYLSYYGLSLARAGLSKRIAVQACRTAAKKNGDDPVLHLNLGRVYLICGNLPHAFRSFEKGLALAPDNRPLRKELTRIERRRPPVISFLSRSHPVNHWLGRVTASRRPRAGLRTASH
jgi:tetratricopeptide (TPR) repeat protein